MPVKPVEKKAGKNDMDKAQGGQDSYAQWDEGRYDREGYGLGQFRSPVSEDSIPKPADPREGATKRIGRK